MIRRIVQPFYTAYAATLFLLSLFIAFPLLVVLSLGPRKAAAKKVFIVVKYWVKYWLAVIGMPVTIEGNKPAKGTFVIVANHISYLDTLAILPSLPGYFKALGKKEISKVPLIGFIYRRMVILVDRDSNHSRTVSMKLMYRFLHEDCSIVIFPEGTFNETDAPLKDFYTGAFRLAISTQTPVLPVIFPDTVDRWHYSAWWKLWPGRNRAIFLSAVPVAGLKNEDLPVLMQTVYAAMDEELRKHRSYPVSSSFAS